MSERLTRPTSTRPAEDRRSARLRLAAILLIVVALVLLAGCTNEGGSASEIVVTGSTTILPIAEIAGERFHEQFPEYQVLVSGLGSSAGIESVAKGSSDIGTSSRDLKPEEDALNLRDTPIALDAIAVIVNPGNPVDGLTLKEVRAIFSGEITNWSQVGGEDRPIGLVNRDEASGTREAFSKIVMGDTRYDMGAAVLPGTGQVRSVVAEAPGAIGYISLGFVNDEVTPVAIDGVEPSVETVASGTYPVQRTLHFFTVGEPEGLAARFVAWVLSDEIQQTVVRDAGFLPIDAGSGS